MTLTPDTVARGAVFKRRPAGAAIQTQERGSGSIKGEAVKRTNSELKASAYEAWAASAAQKTRELTQRELMIVRSLQRSDYTLAEIVEIVPLPDMTSRDLDRALWKALGR